MKIVTSANVDWTGRQLVYRDSYYFTCLSVLGYLANGEIALKIKEVATKNEVEKSFNVDFLRFVGDKSLKGKQKAV